jgi:hypothetical protein
LEENEEVMAAASKACISELKDEVREVEAHVADLETIHKSARNVTIVEHGEWLFFLVHSTSTKTTLSIKFSHR